METRSRARLNSNEANKAAIADGGEAKRDANPPMEEEIDGGKVSKSAALKKVPKASDDDFKTNNSLESDEFESVSEKEDDSSDEDGEELAGELEDIKDDEAYVSFVHDVVSPRAVSPDETEKDDPNFEDISDETGKEAENDEEDALDSDSSDSSEDEEDEILEDEAPTEDVPQADVPIPAQALKEASLRFPPFWRTKNQLCNYEASSYHSDEDSTFSPTESELDQGSATEDDENLSDDEAGEAVEEEIDAQEVSALEDGETDDLAEVMQDLTIRNGEADGEDAEEGQEETVCLVEAIESFNEKEYESDGDPDYEPKDAAAGEAMDSSGHSDAGETEEMEQ